MKFDDFRKRNYVQNFVTYFINKKIIFKSKLLKRFKRIKNDQIKKKFVHLKDVNFLFLMLTIFQIINKIEIFEIMSLNFKRIQNF